MQSVSAVKDFFHCITIKGSETMDRRFFWSLSVAALAASWAPYLFALLIRPPQMVYFWLIYNPDDQNVHLMWSRQAYEGRFFIQDLYTTEPHPGLFFNLFAFFLGLFCRFSGLSLHFSYQLFRTAAAILFLSALRWFASVMPLSQRDRKLFFFFAVFSSGFGWIPLLRDYLTGISGSLYFTDVSPHLNIPEAFSFPSMTVAPLALLGTTLSLTFIGLFFSALTTDQRTLPLLASSLSGAALSHLHPYASPPALLCLFLLCLLQTARERRWFDRRWFFLLIASAPALLVLLFQSLVFSKDPAFLQKALTPTLTPPPLILIGSFGTLAVMSLLALPFAPPSLRQRDPVPTLALCWLASLLICIHLPVSFQRKMMEGFQVPVALLATFAVSQLERRFPFLQKPFNRPALVALTLPSSVAFLLLNGYWLISNNLLPERRMMPPYFLHRDQVALLRWLEKQPDVGAILCNPMIGNYVPVLTGKRVFIGHWAETLNFVEKLRQTVPILKGERPLEEVLTFCRRHRIAFALDTFWERLLSGGQTHLHRYGRPVFQVGDEKVYHIGSNRPSR